MGKGNISFPNTFVLLGFSEFPWLEGTLFVVVLLSYLFTLVGNSFIILLSLVDPRLQTPMYFFLDNLSLLDLSLTCTIVPQLLANIHHTLDHFFCDVPLLLKLACGDTSANELALTSMTIPFGIMSSLLVVISYTFIARAILKLPSAEGRNKALSTCSSHLLVVTMFFGPAMYFYLQPTAKNSQAKFISFFYSLITPLLNPLIYALLNKDVDTACKKILQSQSRVKSLKAQSLPVS
ncbi:Olfactory receptor 2G6 [Heterocephalus glaber]|uniref:Olfactory receptor 2G6 n=1 Tax=Heterocephalus glaber TaxID=10181 RepID=G5C7Q6_HETGA|nr:Olfactory receptor 2G6 [Heterocephalus glaber]